MENNYCQIEIDNMIEELLTIHKAKLKGTEEAVLYELMELERRLTQGERDLLIKMYDSMCDMPGE